LSVVSRSRDDRNHPIKSTVAAIKFLKQLYAKTYEWEGKKLPADCSYDDSNRWAWCFWSYNRGPGKVKMYYKKFKGNPSSYSSHISAINSENSNFVNKMFGIKAALKSYVTREQQLYVDADKKTEADNLYSNYQEQKDNMEVRERLLELEMIKKKFKEETAEKQDSTVSTRMNVIDEEVVSLKNVQKEEKVITDADLGYQEYLRLSNSLSPREKLQKLEEVKKAYIGDRKKKRHSNSYVQASLDVVESEMNSVREENKEAFSKRTNYAVDEGNVKVEVSMNETGEAEASVQYDGTTIDADIVSYKVLYGDKFNDIARRLSGDVNKVHIVKRMIIDLNPEIRNINKIYLGQRIKVPGKYIEVGRVKLKDLLSKYYPKVPRQDAEYYLKYLNGKTPGKDTIRPGEIILVPVIR